VRPQVQPGRRQEVQESGHREEDPGDEARQSRVQAGQGQVHGERVRDEALPPVHRPASLGALVVVEALDDGSEGLPVYERFYPGQPVAQLLDLLIGFSEKV